MTHGLTSLGKKYILELNKKGIIIDVSHLSEKTFWDTAKVSQRPIVATHSCVYSICNHSRNLKDEQIKQIAKTGGVIGICFSSGFLNLNKKADVRDVIKHIKYIVDLVGIDYVSLGSDFDGVREEKIPKDLNGIKAIGNLKEGLYAEGFAREDISKIMGENWYRVLKQNLL